MALNSDLLALIDARIDQKNVRLTAVGTVVEWGPPAAMVLFDGSAVAVPVKAFGVRAGVGHRVGLMKFGTDWTVVGSYSPELPDKGYVTRTVRETASGSFTGQTLVQTATFVADSRLTYKVTAIQHIQSTVANDVANMRLRWRNDTTMTVANSTEFAIISPPMPTAGRGYPWTVIGELSGVAGDVTVGVTFARDTGTGTLLSYGEADRHENLILVEAT
ncbi:hypothetical protein ACGFIY_21415 [Micromonospora chersina]|uniref:hypothetical protein n=1 Tax=Micromonospora chersina TaxID=47854 RepID=UPI0037178AB1